MKSKRKSLTGGKIPKRKSGLKIAEYKSFAELSKEHSAHWNSVIDTANTVKRQQEQADNYNKNKWFFQKEKPASKFDGKPKKRKHNLNLP
jgi:hypothetical protein